MTTMPHARLDLDDLRQTVAEVIDVDESDVTPEARFVEDLGCDSLMALEVVVVLERRYGVKFAEEELKQVTSLIGAHDLVARKLTG